MAINKEKAVGEKSSVLGKAITYIVLGLLAVTIIIPVAWVFMASVKENSEFYGNPFALPKGIHWQNFVDAWTKANMGDYFMTSVMITAMALIILLIVALPAAYVLSRYTFRGSKLLNGGFMAGLFINVNYIVVPIFLMFVSGDRLLNKLFGKGFFLCWLPQPCPSPSICSAAIWLPCPRPMKRRPMWMAPVTSPPWYASSCRWPSPAWLP